MEGDLFVMTLRRSTITFFKTPVIKGNMLLFQCSFWRLTASCELLPNFERFANYLN